MNFSLDIKRLKKRLQETKYDTFAVLSFFTVHLFVFLLWPIGGYGFDSGEYLKMMDAGVFADLHPNGYSFFLNFVNLFSDSPAAPYALNHIFSIGTDIILYFVLRSVFSRKISFLIVMFYTFFTGAIVWDCWLLAESTYLFFLALQIWWIRKEGGLRELSYKKTLFFGLTMGVAFLLRTASIFGVPALLWPCGVGFGSKKMPLLKKYLRRLAVVIGAALLIVLPDMFWYKAETGSYNLTQAMPWNLLYGHSETARCEPTPDQDIEMIIFCDGFADIPEDVKGFPLARRVGSPGWKPIQKYGSFRKAGPPLLRILAERIAANPGSYLAETAKNTGAWLMNSLAWYLPKKSGQFIHDSSVTEIFSKQFSKLPEFYPDRGAWFWIFSGTLILRIVIIGVWLFLLSWLFFKRKTPNQINLLVVFCFVGTVLFGISELRYFAPIELAIFFIVPIDWKKYFSTCGRA